MCADLYAFIRPDLIDDSDWTGEYPPVEKLEQLQRDAREGIHRVEEGGSYRLDKGIGYGITKLAGRIVRDDRRGTLEDQFRAAVMEVVQAFWDRLRECGQCHGRFLKFGKQKYCSPSCASRARWNAFKARRRARDHRAEYAARVKKRFGQKAKLNIKRRRQT